MNLLNSSNVQSVERANFKLCNKTRHGFHKDTPCPGMDTTNTSSALTTGRSITAAGARRASATAATGAAARTIAT